MLQAIHLSETKVLFLSFEGPAEEGGDYLSSFSALLHKAGKLYTEKYSG